MNNKQNTNLDYSVRWLISCLIFLCYGCNNNNDTYDTIKITAQDSIKEAQRIKNAFEKIAAVKKNIQTGYLIVRTGNDFTSESLRSLNQRDKTYSHCGIASIENDSLFVYHALGGEFNPDQRIRRDRFEVFAEPFTNRGIGIYHYAISKPDVENLVVTVKRLHQMGVMFDMDFDLATNNRMYCAEFVYKSYLMGTAGKLQFTLSHIGKFEFIGVDDLFLQPLCSLQQKILY